MLEETLIRETAQAKAQGRQQSSSNISKGPPAGTFAGLSREESKSSDSAAEALNENNFDVVGSPGMRRDGSKSDGKPAANSGKGMVPQEQYDALKTRFIESETQF